MPRPAIATAALEPLRNPPRRGRLLVVSVVCLVVLAGVLAVQAFAGRDASYCYPCTLPASGVPAVSQAHHSSFYDSDMYVASDTYYWMGVYFYSANLNSVMCYAQADVTGYTGVETPVSCTTGPSDTDARCHVTHNSGPAPNSYCEAYFSGA